jgi:hypothetical protein
MTRLPLLVAALLAAVWVASRPGGADGCGSVVRPGERVDVADETALIVWDAKTETQHFVRQATFKSTADDVGFLVPTPTRPQLVAADAALFKELAVLTAPRVETRWTNDVPFGCGGGSPPGPERLAPGGVVVLERARVGDFDAVVLALAAGAKDDPKAGAAELAVWLAEHHYALSPSLQAWLEPYARDGWVLTAFRVAADVRPGGGAVTLATRPVRMSFHTPRPFFPYREPGDQRDERAANVPRLLRVYVASPARVAGALGDAARPWPGQTVWAGEVAAERWADVFRRAQLLTPPDARGWWLTEFEDRSSPRPGTDEVYFSPSADPAAVERRPTIVYTPAPAWWFGLLCCGGPVALVALSVYGVARLRRRPRPLSPKPFRHPSEDGQ